MTLRPMADRRGHPARRPSTAPATPKFSFWSSMADLVRLVLRSTRRG